MDKSDLITTHSRVSLQMCFTLQLPNQQPHEGHPTSMCIMLCIIKVRYLEKAILSLPLEALFEITLTEITQLKKILLTLKHKRGGGGRKKKD